MELLYIPRQLNANPKVVEALHLDWVSSVIGLIHEIECKNPIWVILRVCYRRVSSFRVTGQRRSVP
jgi:hypothetical protein